MRLSEIRQLVRIRGFEPDGAKRLLRRCYDMDDLRRAAQRRLPPPVFGYVDGGADEELTLAASTTALRRWQFRPRVLQDVAEPDLRATALGVTHPAPLALAPTGFTRIVHPEGEHAVARAAAARGLPYCLSTVGTVSIEDIAATGHGQLWFQLYVLRDRNVARALIGRAAAAGYTTLEVTLDTAVGGRRIRDLRTGATMPPTLTPAAIAGLVTRPRYWTSMLRAPGLQFANLTPYGAVAAGETATIADITAKFDPAVSWSDLSVIRTLWPGKLLIKGAIGPADAARAVSIGVDGIHLSNHGGRQLDRSVPAIDLVRPVREAIGEQATIVLDSGIRHGADIAVALARGADLCMIGRGYLYGLGAAGQPGVEHALDMLLAQFRRTLQLLGVQSAAELRRYGDSYVVPVTGAAPPRPAQPPPVPGQPPAAPGQPAIPTAR